MSKTAKDILYDLGLSATALPPYPAGPTWSISVAADDVNNALAAIEALLLGEAAPQDVALPLPKDGKMTRSVADARVEAALKNKLNHDWRQHIQNKLKGK